MARVLVHTRVGGNVDWADEGREMSRIPVVGEFVALEEGGAWFKVEAVVHTLHAGAAYDGEIYARGEEEHTEGITRNIAAAPPR